MTKQSPAKFSREVRQEAARITWPTRRETMISTMMVLLLAGLTATFFLLVDAVIGNFVQWVLGIGV